MTFSDTTTNTGIVEQTRNLMRVDSNQWPTSRIVASVNNYLDTVTGYAIGADRTFQWDDTNHTKLPEGTTNLTAGQTDYSFLTDEQGNQVLTLTRVEAKDSSGAWHLLEEIDQNDVPIAEAQYLNNTSGIPQMYDKVADNVIRIYPTPSQTVANGLKFYFQRTGSYFVASDTVKSPGVANLLHRGFVIAAALDGAISLGLSNLSYIEGEMKKEQQKMVDYFKIRNKDIRLSMKMRNSHSPH